MTAGGGGGGACEVLPLRKAKEKVLAMLLGGGTKCFGVVFIQLLEVVAILKGGGRKMFPLFKRGGHKNFYLVFFFGGGGGGGKFRTRKFPIS